MQRSLKSLLPHLVILVIFVVAALLYFSPVLQGKKLFQSDIAQYIGMSKQQKDFKSRTGEETYWTNSAFGGMPTYQLGAQYPHNYIKKLDLLVRFLPRPADYLFLYFIGIYILFMVLKIPTRIALLGALGFGFSTYLIIILGVGHNAKAHAIAYMPLVISGILLTFRGKYLSGFVLTAIAMALELVANHFQMTYYLLLLVICIGLAYLYHAYKSQQLTAYFKALGVMVLAVILAIGLNATNIMATQQYAAESTRGSSPLSINPDGSPKTNTDGLDYSYITEYSYGKMESFNLFIPRLMGGGSSESLPFDGATYEALLKVGAPPAEAGRIAGQLPVYWGDQPIVAAPAYLGAVMVFLALFSLFYIRGRLKWWAVSAFLLSLFLSWGKNFSLLTDLFIEYVPLYDKFRAVSSIQVIIELVIPILATVGLYKFIFGDEKTKENQRRLFISVAIAGGLALMFALFGSALLDFASPFDTTIREQLGNEVVEAIREDRAALLVMDSLRSLVFVLLAAVLLYLSMIGKFRKSFVLTGLTLLVVIDLVGVDYRYVNTDDFVPARMVDKPFEANPADLQIMQDEGHFRVYDLTTNPFNSGRASYFHNALGGYHAAKPRRMQDLDDFYLADGDIGILNMFNVRYIITQGPNGTPYAQRNPYANGNAWFVSNVLIAEDADREIQLLDSLDTRNTAVVHREFADLLPRKAIERDSLAVINLVGYQPDQLIYESNSSTDQLAVFSEMYYPHGWKVTIDGQEVQQLRANYALRALIVPAGQHRIEFSFEPAVVAMGSTVSFISSGLLLLILIGLGYRYWKGEPQSDP
jgi:hypothetical protein